MKTKRILALLVALIMVFQLMPAAFADDSDGATRSTDTTTLRGTGETKTVLVGVISYLINEFGEDANKNWKVHYWGGADGAQDAACVATGDTSSRSVGSEYWNNETQTFTMFTAQVPSDATGFKVRNGDRWFGDDGIVADHCSVYVFNYSGDKALYVEHNWGAPTYEWAADNSTVTAKRVCSICNEAETETVNTTSAVTTEATCETAGSKTWTSGAFTNAAFAVQTKSST